MTRSRRELDLWLLGGGLAATFLGLFFIFDAGYPRSLAKGWGMVPPEFRQQGIYLFLAVAAYWLISRMSVARLRKVALPVFFITLFSLIAVEFIGKTQNGAKRWLSLGGIMVQPAEFMKIAVILFLAAVFAERKRWPRKLPKFDNWRTYIDVVWTAKIRRIWPGLLVLLAFGLIEHEPDLGTASVVLATALFMFILGGVSWKTMGWAALVLGIMGGIYLKKEPYRLDRLKAHVYRWESKNMDDLGYQTVQSEAGMAAGSLVGVGIGAGRAKHVMPAATTDFIMATISEETGLLGSLVVIGVIGLIVSRLWSLSRRSEDQFSSLVLGGTAAWIGIQTTVNVMMANGMLPAIGIPLPFISSGGSSLVALWAALGICQVVAPERVPVEARDEARTDGWRDRRTYLPGT